jgi:hypothetical protein
MTPWLRQAQPADGTSDIAGSIYQMNRPGY